MKSIFLVFVFFSGWCTAQKPDSTKIIVMEFMHGSVPKKHSAEPQYLGRMYGGHVVIKMDSSVYGFTYISKHVHLFPLHHVRGLYEKQTPGEWNAELNGVKVTRIYIPVSKAQFDSLHTIYENYHQRVPHDYAFFGMRCAASAYWMLGKIGVVHHCSRFKSILRAFHPKELRKRMVRIGEERKYFTEVTPGRKTRHWEGD